MSKLHELLAVEGNIESAYRKALEETKTTFQKRPAHFFGRHKTLEMFDENAPKAPDEYQELQTTVQEKLEYQADHIIRYLDAVLQKERTNQEARADLVVDGVTLASDVPATFLLGLENKLKTIRSVYDVIPTLPPGVKWEPDESKGAHVYRRVHPEEKFKTARTFRHKVLYEATKEHPAQIEKWEETENVGKYIENQWCGMLSPAEKSTILGRLDKLIRATKKARQKANATEVVHVTIGKELFDFINAS